MRRALTTRDPIVLGVLMFVLLSAFSAACLAQQESESSRKIVSRVIPGYPELARKMGVKGTVRLEATVAPGGTVKQISPTGGHPLLLQAAQNAVAKWKWEPANHETTESIELKFNPQD